MSPVVRKILVLSLALILSFVFVGCAEEELTQEEVYQIVANAATATAEVDTYKFDMDMPITMEVIGGDEPGKMTMVADSTGVVSNVSKEMQMTMDMTMDIPDLGKQEMAMEFYIVSEWMYMKIDIPEVGEQWMKMRLTEEMWDEQSQIEQQMQFLTAPMEVNFLGSESVNGTACYVVEIMPTMEALSKWLSQQQIPGTEDIDWAELDLAAIFKEMSVKEWVAKDSYLLMKSEVRMLMEMSPEDVGVTEEDFEKMTMDMNIGMKFYDYNQRVSIGLPEGALGATEIPGN